jgi:hypothetical protein
VYTPINKFRLNSKGRKVFEYYENIIKIPFYKDTSRTLYLKKVDFELLRDGILDKENHKNSIPFGEHIMVSAGK